MPRGGARIGAGSPTKGLEKRVRGQLTLEPRVWAMLDALSGDGSRSDVVTALVEKAFQARGLRLR